jgi:hypothetical protein
MSSHSGGSRVQFGPADKHKGIARSPRGRTCESPGCTTLLSTYNVSNRCWVHARPDYSHPLKA